MFCQWFTFQNLLSSMWYPSRDYTGSSVVFANDLANCLTNSYPTTFQTESPSPFVIADLSHPPPSMVRRLFHKRDTVTFLVSGRIDFRAKRAQFTFLMMIKMMIKMMMMIMMMFRIRALRFCFFSKELCFVLDTVLQQRVRSSFSSKEPCCYQR